MGNICIFEDKRYTGLLPLVWVRTVYELRTGMRSLFEKITSNYKNTNVNLFCRDILKDVVKERYDLAVNSKIDSDCLFINGRLLMDKSIPIDGSEEIGINKEKDIVYIRLKKSNAKLITSDFILNCNLEKLRNTLKNVNVLERDGVLINYPWDLVHYNPEQIKEEFSKFCSSGGKIEGKVYEGVVIIDKKNLFIGKNAKIKPGVVIDNEEGPVYIDEDVLVEPNAVIRGPSYIGKKSIIRLGAKIREGTSIGEVCRIGGEVEESIIHSYSNKQHDGFLGHGYISMWCNLGAGTNNSDLKNNYGNVKVYVEGKLIDSGSMFVGLTMADHSKSGIGTTFNTGTVVGMSSNIFGEGYPPKFVPSFIWGGAKEFVPYTLDKAIDVADKVMSRRKKQLTKSEQELFKKIFELTKSERG